MANGGSSIIHFGIHSRDDEVALLDLAADTIDVVRFQFAEDIGQSWARSPDASGEFALHSHGIGSQRQLFSAGTTLDDREQLPDMNQSLSKIVINEIHTDPAAGMLQFPVDITLAQNYPNPFNNQTTIRFSVPEQYSFGTEVQLTIFDILGRRVQTLVSEKLFPGEFTIVWNGTTSGGQRVASGMYVYQLIIDSRQSSYRMILSK